MDKSFDIPNANECECCSGGKEHYVDCLICGEKLIYSDKLEKRTCAICGQEKLSNAQCANGHFICDTCHSSKADRIIPVLLTCKETDPETMFEMVVRHKGIHMHGPEHHIIVPCVLLTAYYNNGGKIILEDALKEALKRAKQLPGGICGFWGVCGAAAGTGIFASIVLKSTPLNAQAWSKPQNLVSTCLRKLAEIGGPRCCKRVSRLCIEIAAEFSSLELNIPMTAKAVQCRFCAQNKECIGATCPYYPTEAKLEVSQYTEVREVIEKFPTTYAMFSAVGLCCIDAAEGTIEDFCNEHRIDVESFMSVMQEVINKEE